MPLVSVVLSFRNEAENIPTLVARLAAMFAEQPVDYELIFVNDASTDRSLDLLIGRTRAESTGEGAEHVAALRRGGGRVRRHGGVAR